MGWNVRGLQRICLLSMVWSSLLLASPQAEQLTITTGSLFDEMVDMANLAKFPEPAFRTVQFSSYDHRSRLPGGPDWFANSDGFGGEPIPNFEKVLRAPDANGVGEYLIADVNGPGAIVRLWTAAISGSVQMYLDGSQSPVYEGSADDFFHRPYDHFSQIDSIDKDRFHRTIYQRDASYAPIPFAKRLRVLWTGNTKEIHFYQLQVRLYNQGASVVSFRPEDIREFRETIDRVSLVLSDPDKGLPSGSRQEPTSLTLDPKGAGSDMLAGVKGPGAISQLSVQLTAQDMDKALRQTLLTITCDGYPWGQVQAPVGDFFGAAPGINPYQSLPFTVHPEGTMVCRYVMPYERSCRAELHNLGDQIVHAKGTVHTIPFAWDERSMHFRARWRVDHDLIASNRAVQDLPFLLADGKGVYVGTGVYLMNPCPVPTPYGNWWGEGDEKVFVDREAVPSTFGTGSEDYFNYSWSSPDIFTHPYCGQPRNDGPGNRGFVTNYRWHILDSIPFQESIRFYMELYSHERTPGMSYARIGYHYARPGATDDHRILLPKTLELPVLPPWQPAARMGAAKSEFFVAEEAAVDATGTTLKEAAIWAGAKLLVWTPQNKGDRKDFRIPVRTAGKKQVHVAFALTPQSGSVAFLLDGKPLQREGKINTMDLQDPHRILLRSVALMPTELQAGDHTLSIEFAGAQAGISRPEIGIDFLWVQDK